jgi:two-component system cell cycle response regulator
MDGLALTRKLRSDARTRLLPIVALTAFAMLGDEEKARAAGCDGYITKPIDTRTLPARVSAFLPQKTPPTSTSGLKILVIEDVPAELKLAQLVLESNGHHVNGAAAAERALLAIKEDQPEIILLDMMLPGIDGLALARLLKADPETSGIQIVAVTAHPERFSRKDAMAAGCDAYITKPINARELVNQIEQATSGTKSNLPVEGA